MDIILKIKSIFVKDGADQAVQQLDKLGKVTGTSAEKSTQAAKASVSASEGFAMIGSASSAASGNIGSVSSALGQLVSKLPVLAKIAGPLALGATAVMALKNAYDAYAEAKSQAAEASEQARIEKEIAGIERIQKAYENAKTQIAAAADEINRFYSADQARDDTQTQKELAQMELHFAQKEAALDPSDTFGSRRLDVARAEARSNIMDAAENRRLQRELDQLRARGAVAEDSIQSEKIKEQAYLNKIQALYRQRSSAYERVTEEVSERTMPWQQKKNAEQLEKLIQTMDRLSNEINKIQESVQTSRNAQQQGSRELFTMAEQAGNLLVRQREIKPLEFQTAAVGRSATRAGIETDFSKYQAEQLAKRVEQQKQEQEQRMSRSEANSNVLAAQKSLRQSRNSGASLAEIAELKAALNQAKADRAETLSVLTDYARKAAADAAYAKNAIQNLPNN